MEYPRQARHGRRIARAERPVTSLAMPLPDTQPFFAPHNSYLWKAADHGWTTEQG